MNYEKFKKATETLGLLSKSNKSELKRKYLKLSKKYHPDMQNGDETKFREINEAYKTIKEYMENYKFMLDEREFNEQLAFFDKQFNQIK